MMLSVNFHYEDHSITTIQEDDSVLSISFNILPKCKVFTLKNIKLIDNGVLLDSVIRDIPIVKISYKIGELILNDIDLTGMRSKPHYTLDTTSNSEVIIFTIEPEYKEVKS